MNLQTLKDQKGFTIVELLIVIVVIGILAAITIVAFNGVQNRAKATRAQNTAVEVQKKAEAINADTGVYPAAFGDFTGDIGRLSTGITFNTATNVTATNGENTVVYTRCPATGTVTGATIRWFDYAASGGGALTPVSGGKTITVGTCS